MEDVQRELARRYVIYSDGETDVSRVVDTMAQQYGIPLCHPALNNMESAKVAIKKAAETLHQEDPFSGHYYRYPSVVLQTLLQRNYRLVSQAKTIFAFGHLERDCKRLLGGTGWSVQMALDMEKDVFVYDIETSTWFCVDCRYEVDPDTQVVKRDIFFSVWLRSTLPILDQSSAILGSWRIGSFTRNAIRNLFH